MPIRARSEDKKVKIVKGKRTRDADFYKKSFEMTIGELLIIFGTEIIMLMVNNMVWIQ